MANTVFRYLGVPMHDIPSAAFKPYLLEAIAIHSGELDGGVAVRNREMRLAWGRIMAKFVQYSIFSSGISVMPQLFETLGI